MAKSVGQDAVTVIVNKIKANTAAIETNRTALQTLNGTGAGSVSKAVSDGIASVVDNAPATFDTLKEVADWIENDTTGAAAMAGQIASVQSSITTINQSITNLQAGGGVEFFTTAEANAWFA